MVTLLALQSTQHGGTFIFKGKTCVWQYFNPADNGEQIALAGCNQHGNGQNHCQLQLHVE